MKMTFWSLLVLGALSPLGCGLKENLSEGASSIFVKGTYCPPARVKVTPRPDIPPHTIYGSRAVPPPEVAADPERERIWERQNGPNVDTYSKTFEVEGCGNKVLYVCGHPWLNRNLGPFSASAVTDTDGNVQVSISTENYVSRDIAVILSDEVVSTVICMPGNGAAAQTSGASG